MVLRGWLAEAAGRVDRRCPQISVGRDESGELGSGDELGGEGGAGAVGDEDVRLVSET